jgi:hypothetical protein
MGHANEERTDMMSRTRRLLGALTALFLVAATLHGPGAKASPADGKPVLTPVDGQPNDHNFPPLPDTYQQREYFLDGEARSYAPGAPDERVPYRTRIVVRTPIDPADFNGTVIVEWFNVSAGEDQAPNYLDSQAETHRRGYAWVGVSAQHLGVRYLQAVINPIRYQSLNHPGDDYSWDIYSQAGHVLKQPGERDPLAHLRDRLHDSTLKLIGTGQSQSASRLTTYISTGALRDGKVYDALLLNSGGTTTFLPSAGDVPSVPTIHVMSESEARPPVPSAERPTGRYDGELYRLWWVAGSAHIDWHQVSGVRRIGAFPLPTPVIADLRDDRHGGSYGELGGPRTTCPANKFPKRYSVNAALRALDAWIRNGPAAPPSSAEFEYDPAGALVRDGDNNVLGGLRLAPMDVPVAGYVGNSCGLLGHTEPFDDFTLRSRYATHTEYLTQLTAAAEGDVAERILLREDAQDLLRRAEGAAFRWQGVISLPYPAPYSIGPDHHQNPLND